MGIKKKTGSGGGLLGPLPDWWREHWRGMPEFVQDDLSPWRTVEVRFGSDGAVNKLEKLLNRQFPKGKRETQCIWCPEITKKGKDMGRGYYNNNPVSPRYPIYVISKGRWESRFTSKALEARNIPYNIVIEPQEYCQYASVIDPKKILVLPFSNLGQGSIPARNWVWEHSISMGAKRHWILDDNIRVFYRLNRNCYSPVMSGVFFRVIEDFADRYENLVLAGPNYEMFVLSREKMDPFRPNTRIYSCILIDNSIPFRWRGRYNEDTDLSLRCLKAGWCTALFNAFLACKMPTMVMKGGNTDELYKGDGRLAMAESLQEQHPDVTKITKKWHRWQHHVDYRGFQGNDRWAGLYDNVLVMRPGLEIPDGPNEYGMALRDDGPPRPCRVPY